MFSSIIVFWLLKYSVTFDKDKDKDHSFHPSLSPSDSLNFLDKLSTEMSPSLSHPLCLTLSSAQSLPLPGVQAYILKHGLCPHGPRPLCLRASPTSVPLGTLLTPGSEVNMHTTMPTGSTLPLCHFDLADFGNP